MFRKPYKIKTSTSLKASDRKKIRNLIVSRYPKLSVDDLIPGKSDVNQVKAMTHDGKVILIFYFGSNPIFFQIEEYLYPTLYTLWTFPKLLPVVTTMPPVLEKMCSGADLMAPGVVINDLTEQGMNTLKKGEICAVRLLGNVSPVAVGNALMSFQELSVHGVKGKAVAITHCYKDCLWQSGSCMDIPISLDPSSEVENGLSSDVLSADVGDEEYENTVEMEEKGTEDQKEDTDIESDLQLHENVPQYTMDDILYKSFMTAIKISGKKIQLPILTSTFYSSYVLKSCPPQLNLDIKKSSYKKFSVFLKKMQKEGIVQVKELSKGVESIVSLNMQSEHIKLFSLDSLFKNYVDAQKAELSSNEAPSASIQENYKFPSVVELLVISAQVKSLFEFSQMKKGDVIPHSVVRDVIKHYVKENSLQNEENPREVILDPILSDCISKKNSCQTMTWEDLYDAIISKMPPAYQIEFEGKEPLVKKGKLEPIQITVDTRTGNKKVTLIQNLETFGISPEKLAQHIQIAVAASTSITPTQNGKGVLVLIQGNQLLYLQKLFLDIYKVPRKYLQGLENVTAKKK